MLMELPKTKVKASRKSPKNMIIYGPPKIGKTSVLAELDDCLLIDLEDGSDMVDALKVKAHSLKDLQAIGTEIIRSTTPGQMIVKVVFDEIIKILGDVNVNINLNVVPPACIMLVGLQGSGKTTTAAKLAKYLEKNNKKKILLVSLDVYRPAAQEQLNILNQENDDTCR